MKLEVITMEKKERGENAKNSCHFILPATPKSSTCTPGQYQYLTFVAGTELSCYPARDQQVLEELWGSSFHRAVLYVTCVILLYVVGLIAILMQETYQVRGQAY